VIIMSYRASVLIFAQQFGSWLTLCVRPVYSAFSERHFTGRPSPTLPKGGGRLPLTTLTGEGIAKFPNVP
jgi:hypothetical protein